MTSPQHHAGAAAATRPPLHDVAHPIYLRTWDDYEQHTVKLTAHDTSGISWKDGDPGIGPTYLFRDPDGHELYWETEWYAPPEEHKPALKNQAQAYPGAAWACGGWTRVTEQIMLDDGTISGQWLHFTNKGYDLVYTRDWTGSAGRLHHVAFTPDTR